MEHERDAPSGRVEVVLLAVSRRLVARPWTVLAVWVLIVAGALPFAQRLPEVLTQQAASKVVPGTSSARATDIVTAEFPQHSERETVVVLSGWDPGTVQMRQALAVLDAAIGRLAGEGQVLQSVSAYTLHRDAVIGFVDAQLAAAPASSSDRPTPADRGRLASSLQNQHVPAALAALVQASQGLDASARTAHADDFVVASDWSQFPLPVSTRDVLGASGHTALVTVSYGPKGPDPDTNELRRMVSSVLSSLHLENTIEAHVTGEIPLLQDTYARAESDNAKMELVAYGIIFLVLLLFFRAVLPAVLTVMTIGLAMNVSQAWLYLLGRQVHLTQFTVTIMTFVMLGAGIDYSMLLSSRYRQERLAGRSVQEAVILATARAGESVLLAGAAVVLSFGATLLSPVDWIPPLGYGGLVGIPLVLFAALTITPCLLVILGDRFFWLGVRPLSDLESSGAVSTVLRGVMSAVRVCPAAIVAVFALLTVPLAFIVTQHPLSADPIALSPDTDARRGAAVVASEWGASTLFPTIITGPLPATLYSGGALTGDGEKQLRQLVSTVAADPGVARVSAVTNAAGSDQPGTPVASLPLQVRRDYLSDHGVARIVVALRGESFSPDARATVDRLADIVVGQGPTSLHVGGATRVDAQYDASLRSSFWRMIGTVAAGVFVLLLFALRSVLIPIRLIITIMMGNVWAIAITVVVFQIWRHDAVINDLPVFLVILMMGLGMDYEIFLITRVRDLVRRGDDDATATAAAVTDTGRVITAAGMVMAGSLGTMMLSSTLMLQQYGLGLGAAVLLDSTVVRMFLVPASLLLFRRLNWWVPNVALLRPARR